MRDLLCLRCGTLMTHSATEQFQLGQTGWILGDLPNLIAGSLELDIYSCPQCGKVELFTPEQSARYSQEELPQVYCPACGAKHDFDYPKCPHCGHRY